MRTIFKMIKLSSALFHLSITNGGGSFQWYKVIANFYVKIYTVKKRKAYKLVFFNLATNK